MNNYLTLITQEQVEKDHEHLLLLAQYALHGPKSQAFAGALSRLLELTLSPEEIWAAGEDDI